MIRNLTILITRPIVMMHYDSQERLLAEEAARLWRVLTAAELAVHSVAEPELYQRVRHAADRAWNRVLRRRENDKAS